MRKICGPYQAVTMRKMFHKSVYSVSFQWNSSRLSRNVHKNLQIKRGIGNVNDNRGRERWSARAKRAVKLEYYHMSNEEKELKVS